MKEEGGERELGATGGARLQLSYLTNQAIMINRPPPLSPQAKADVRETVLSLVSPFRWSLEISHTVQPPRAGPR